MVSLAPRLSVNGPRRKFQWCDMHYWRMKNWGDLERSPAATQRDPRTPLERIKKDPLSGCWVWDGRLSAKGYGQLNAEGKRWAAYRYFYEQLVGPIPDGLQIDHLCRNRACVNPAHLEPVTLQENLARGTGKSATALRHNTCVNGHALTEDNVYRAPSRPKSRHCRTCIRERGARKAKAAAPGRGAA